MTAPQYPQYPPRRKHRVWPWILLTVILLFGGCFAIVGTAAHETSKALTTSSNASPASAELQAHNSPAPATDIATVPPLTAAPSTKPGKTIVYEIISDAATLNSVTYFDAKSAEQQVTDVSAPWSLTVTNNSTVAIAGIGAQTNGQSVTCRITVNGVVADQKTSTGQYAVVNCDAPL